jgi:hypothetical protein
VLFVIGRFRSSLSALAHKPKKSTSQYQQPYSSPKTSHLHRNPQLHTSQHKAIFPKTGDRYKKDN